jgi:NTE family protein
MQKIPPEYIMLSGGGVKVISMIGALKALNEQKYLRKLREISGVSAGALLALIIAYGMEITRLESIFSELDLGIIRNLNPESLIYFPETFGLDDGTMLVKFLESFLRIVLKLDPSITFLEFHSLEATKIQFRCWATDLKELTNCEFSLEKTPSVRILDALRASMSIPIYFTPLKHPESGNLLVDGGIQGDLPLHLFTEKQRLNCIGIGFLENIERHQPGKNNNPPDLMEFITAILECSTRKEGNLALVNLSEKIIKIPGKYVSFWNFEISRDQRIRLIKSGYDAAVEWLSNRGKSGNKKFRRHSLQ